MTDTEHPTRCERAHQMHMFDLHYEIGTGIYIRKCINCGLTEAEIKARKAPGP